MACGDYDIYVMMAARYHWTPEQVNALPIDFIEELGAFHDAEKRVQDKREKDAERAAKRRKR